MKFLTFLNPFGDGLSIFFVILLVILSGSTIFCLYRNAKEENWEQNWHGQNTDNNVNLDSEYGSVHELSEAVATKTEQVAEIMPSMLLIIGLLGTFIGLGIALNSASEVLTNANTAGMDKAMSHLMSLMEGLGAKFKTSTWGLLCFIVLNVLFNILGFKEKRLAWTIHKIQQETKAKNLQKIKLEQDRYEKLLESIMDFNKQTQISNHTHLQELKANLNAVRALEQQSQQNSTDLIHNLQNQNQQVVTTLRSGFNQHIKQLQNDNNNHLNELKNLIISNKALEELSQKNSNKLIQSLNTQNRQVIETLTKGFEKHIQQIQKDSNHHISELKNIVFSNQAIQKASEITTAELKNVVVSLTEGFEENSAQLQNSSKKSLIELKKIADYNKQTQQAMQNFVENTVSSMASIGNSANKMGESAEAVGAAASDLNKVIGTLKLELNGVMSKIKTDLGETITNMGDSFEQNMANMSSAMSHATQGISSAVQDLSANVGSTMTEVTQTIEKSMNLQEASAREFTVTSDTLNKQIVAMTNLVESLSNDIVNSLTSVATNGRRMESIGKKLHEFANFFETLSQTNPQIIENLGKLADSNQDIHQTLTEFSRQNNNDLLRNLIEINHKIQNKLTQLTNSSNQYYQTKHYEELLEQIDLSIKKLVENSNKES